MNIVESRKELRTARRAWREESRCVGLVPTMGALHEGHLALVRRAVEDCDRSVVSVFVNPTQFGPDEDFEQYPRDLDGDARMLEECGVDLLFAPSAAEVFPAGLQTRVVPGSLAQDLCGASRPGHFEGVATVVTKLFHMVEPDRAYFGQKDYQQARILQAMVEELDFPLQLLILPTVRESDGLALSSRNRRLSAAQRAQAVQLHQALQAIGAAFDAGERDARRLVECGRRILSAASELREDYLEVRDDARLEPLPTLGDAAVAAVAAFAGSVRLIDNLLLGRAAQRLE